MFKFKLKFIEAILSFIMFQNALVNHTISQRLYKTLCIYSSYKFKLGNKQYTMGCFQNCLIILANLDMPISNLHNESLTNFHVTNILEVEPNLVEA